MTTALHLALADLRRVRWAALVWGVVYLAIPVAEEVTARTFELPAGAQHSRQSTTSLFLARTFLEPLLAWLVTVLIVQGDPVPDSRAFWRTRPIAPSTLLASKATGLALLLIGIPVLVNVVRFGAYGVPATSLLAMTLQLVTSRAAWIGFGLLLAALTGTLQRLLLVLVGLVGLLVAASSLVLPLLMAGGTEVDTHSHFIGSVSVGFWGMGLPEDGFVSFVMTTLVIALGTLLLYARRARRAAVASLVAAVVLPGSLGGFGARGLGPPLPDSVRNIAAQSGRVESVALVPSAPQNTGADSASPMQAVARLSLVDLPLHLTADLQDLEATVRTARDGALRGKGRALSAMHEFPSQSLAAGLMPCTVVKPPPYCSRELQVTLLDLREADRARFHGAPLRVDISGRLHVAEHRAVARVPLQSATTIRRPGYLLEIMQVERRRTGVGLTGRFTRFPTLRASPAPQVELFVRRGDTGAMLTVLPRGVPGTLTVRVSSTTPRGLQSWGANIQELFLAMHGLQRQPFPVTPATDWSQNVELVIVESTYIGSTPVRWTADNLRIVETSEPPSP